MKSLDFFSKEILKYYQRHGRASLPWRKNNVSAYEIWVSEVFLQQTQVCRVIPFYKRFLKRFPNVQILARSTWKQFLPYYEGLGYYRRGENMLKAARMVVEQYNGIFPNNKKELMELPGVGEYTANAILAFSYNENVLAFDTNLQRVFGRYLHGNKKAIVNHAFIETSITQSKNVLSAAVMDFANGICIQTPKCKACPLSQQCVYFLEKGNKEKREDQRTKKQKSRRTFPTKKARVYLRLHKDHKIYYSSKKKSYDFFYLSSKCNTRATIKDYFQKKYKLTLSVRPPHKKTFVKGKAVLFINAQILAGKCPFVEFTKEELSVTIDEKGKL